MKRAGETKVRKPRLSPWPRLTRYQKDLIVRFDRSHYGDLHGSLRDQRSLWRLVHEGMIERGLMGWYHITQRGRDFVRFCMRARRTQ